MGGGSYEEAALEPSRARGVISSRAASTTAWGHGIGHERNQHPIQHPIQSTVRSTATARGGNRTGRCLGAGAGLSSIAFLRHLIGAHAAREQDAGIDCSQGGWGRTSGAALEPTGSFHGGSLSTGLNSAAVSSRPTCCLGTTRAQLKGAGSRWSEGQEPRLLGCTGRSAARCQRGSSPDELLSCLNTLRLAGKLDFTVLC